MGGVAKTGRWRCQLDVQLNFIWLFSSRSHLEPSWEDLGPSRGHLGPSWGHHGHTWGHLGAILGPGWGTKVVKTLGTSFKNRFLAVLSRFLRVIVRILGHVLSVLTPSWASLGDLGAILERCWGILGPSWAILGHLGAILGLSWAILGPCRGHFQPSWGHLE